MRVASAQVNDRPLTEKWAPTEWGPDDKAGAINRINPTIVLKALKLVKEPISLETPIGDEEQSSLGDFVEDELAPSPVEAAFRGNLGELTRKVLATLSPREEQILRMRFGIDQKTDCTLEEVGKQFAVTRERIRQIEARALRKLRHTGRSRNLEGFIERE